MAGPNLSGKLIIMLGNGATPTELFAFPCGANARSVTLTNELGGEVLLDCTDPLNGGAWMSRWLESQDTQLSISGRVDKTAFGTWKTWADAGSKKNCKVMFDEPAPNGGYWTLPAYLQNFEIGMEGSGEGSMTFTATIMGAGKRVWTAAI